MGDEVENPEREPAIEKFRQHADKPLRELVGMLMACGCDFCKPYSVTDKAEGLGRALLGLLTAHVFAATGGKIEDAGDAMVRARKVAHQMIDHFFTEDP